MANNEDSPWLFKNADTAKLQIDFKNKILTYPLHSIKKLADEQAFAFGGGTSKKLKQAICSEKITFEIREFPSGQAGRASERYWFYIIEPNQEPKDLLEELGSIENHQQTNVDPEESKLEEQPKNEDSIKSTEPPASNYDHILKPKWQKKLDKRLVGKQLKTPLSKIFTLSLLEKLKLRPDTKFDNYLGWPLRKLAKLFDYSSQFHQGTSGSVIEIFKVWHESILKSHNKEETRRHGVLTNGTTGKFFGVSPGLPQLIVTVSEDLVADGALFENVLFSFAKFTYDDDGRVMPNHIQSPLPHYPRREVMSPTPHVIRQTDDAIQQIRKILCKKDGEVDVEQLPLSLVAMKKKKGADEWLADGQSFEEIVSELSKELKFDCLFEPEMNYNRWPNVYSKVFQWCLIYKKEGPPESVPSEKDTHYTKNFPIYLDARHNFAKKKMGFCWFKSARGRVHDLALAEVMEDWRGIKHDKRWLLLGDETGQGKELVKGVASPKQNKSFAYIWVLIPPNCFPPSVASDFHGMDQHQFAEEHLRVLSNLMKDENLGITTLIFETTNHLEFDEKLPKGNQYPSPSLVRMSLPIVLEYVKQHTPVSNDTEYVIQTLTEEYGEAWARGANTDFVNSLGQQYCDFFSNSDKAQFKFDRAKIVGKLDHPWLNYADAIGFLTGDTIPRRLSEHKFAIEESIHEIPIYIRFMQDEFPSLAASLASNPVMFVKQLLDVNSVHIHAYLELILRGMLNQAFERFSPLDWRQFNNMMKEKQSTAQGRIVAKRFVQWSEPNYQDLLDSLETDADRVNMCLTQAWSMDQQGGGVTSKISFIKPDWLHPNVCPQNYRDSITGVIFASRQNYFDFETKTPMLLELGIMDKEILTPRQLNNELKTSTTLKEENMKRLGIFFTTFAFQDIKEDEEMLWEANQRFVDYSWREARDNRRHCIYGAEYALDRVDTDLKWLNRAKSRLNDDFERYLSTGEDRRNEPFWWPTELKYWTYATQSDPESTNKINIESLLKKSARFATEGLLPVRVRTLYWMARLAEIYHLNNVNECYDQLEAFTDDQEYPKNDVYGALLYVHLIDLDERRETTDRSKYRDEFMAALIDSRKTTRAHFEKYMKDESLPILDSLKFNYL